MSLRRPAGWVVNSIQLGTVQNKAPREGYLLYLDTSYKKNEDIS